MCKRHHRVEDNVLLSACRLCKRDSRSRKARSAVPWLRGSSNFHSSAPAPASASSSVPAVAPPPSPFKYHHPLFKTPALRAQTARELVGNKLGENGRASVVGSALGGPLVPDVPATAQPQKPSIRQLLAVSVNKNKPIALSRALQASPRYMEKLVGTVTTTSPAVIPAKATKKETKHERRKREKKEMKEKAEAAAEAARKAHPPFATRRLGAARPRYLGMDDQELQQVVARYQADRAERCDMFSFSEWFQYIDIRRKMALRLKEYNERKAAEVRDQQEEAQFTAMNNMGATYNQKKPASKAPSRKN